MKHVILGNGPAGVIAAETLRKHRPRPTKSSLIGDEPEPPYSRMAIPYLLMGNIGEEGHLPAQGRGPLRAASASTLRTRARRRRSTRGARNVRLDDGDARSPTTGC